MIRKIIVLVLSVSAIGVIVMALSGLRTEAWVAYHTARHRIVGQVYYGRLMFDFRRYREPLMCLQCTAEYPDHAPSCGYSEKPWPHPMNVTIPEALRDPGAPRESSIGIPWDEWPSVTGEPMYGVATADNWRVEIPNLHLLVLLAAYPTLWLIRGPLRRRRRRKRGLCIECGYNLTGLTALRCPECSAEFTPMENREQSQSSAPG